MADYFIGIDGGGTKSKLVLVNRKLEILSEQIGGGTNLLITGTANAAKIFLQLINKAIAEINISLSEINGITIGTAGAGRHKQIKLLKNKLSNLLINEEYLSKNISITNDAEITLKGAFPNNDGIILIAGTGSILYGKDKYGKIFRIGGMGKLIGDEGSGYSIGKKGISLVSKMFDGRESPSALYDDFMNTFKIRTQAEMINAIYNKDFDISGFAEYVINAAEKGNEKSIGILETESDELLKHIQASLKILGNGKIKLSLSGSLIAKTNYYSALLKRKISEKFKNVNLYKPKYSPEIGAALLSIENFEQINDK